MADNRMWTTKRNVRGYMFYICKGHHVALSDMKEDPSIDNFYLRRTDVPPYPESVVFNVSNVCHVTGEYSFWRIIKDGGFRKPYHLPVDDDFLWWSLSVTLEELHAAEEDFYKVIFPEKRRVDDNLTPRTPFLKPFTTSPTFQESSLYGNFKFTFSLKVLLRHYSNQFCDDSGLVLRVMDTKIYKQEIMYSVLVHPARVSIYNQFPRLPFRNEGVCGYSPGKVWWRCQSPSNKYNYRLEVDKVKGSACAVPLNEEKFAVWDHVAVAFHMEPDWTLHVDRQQLLSSVSVCEVASERLLKEAPLGLADAHDVLENVKRSVDRACYY